VAKRKGEKTLLQRERNHLFSVQTSGYATDSILLLKKGGKSFTISEKKSPITETTKHLPEEHWPPEEPLLDEGGERRNILDRRMFLYLP